MVIKVLKGLTPHNQQISWQSIFDSHKVEEEQNYGQGE